MKILSISTFVLFTFLSSVVFSQENTLSYGAGIVENANFEAPELNFKKEKKEKKCKKGHRGGWGCY